MNPNYKKGEWTRFRSGDNDVTEHIYYAMVNHSQEKRMQGLHVNLKFSVTKILGWKELKDITPWDHNNYKTPTDTKNLHHLKVSVPLRKFRKNHKIF